MGQDREYDVLVTTFAVPLLPAVFFILLIAFRMPSISVCEICGLRYRLEPL
jgi:hypothetical protein